MFMDKQTKKNKYNRRDLIKGLITMPVLGAFFYALHKKKKFDRYIKGHLAEELNLSYEAPSMTQYRIKPQDKLIRIGIIGYGGRGEDLLRSTGYIHPDVLKKWYENYKENPHDRKYPDYMEQEDLNVEVMGVCDVFDVRAERALKASGNKEKHTDESKIQIKAKRYRNYKELLASKDIDAVIIATPDHWHAQMVIDAANAGKHIYVEKPLTRTVEEAFLVRDAVQRNAIVFQLGHQGRQTESYIKAKEAIEKNILGKISLIQVCTNRNDPNGAWVYPIHPDANEKTIDWQQWLGSAPQKPFNLEHFHRWRCWWDYGTGLAGDLFTHEFDGVNQIMQLGIPHSVIASGGIYFYKDGRTVPDVYHAVCEYPDRDLTLLYSATLASERYRGKIFMGHDASMEVDNGLIITVDKGSTRYAEKIKNKIIDPKLPLYMYKPGMKEVDAITTATESYFAGRGLLYTYRDGKKYNTTFLHIKEWLDAIRNNLTPSCNIDQAFQEAIAAHMGTISLMEKRQIFWDADREKIVY